MTTQPRENAPGLRYRLRWWLARYLMKSSRLCPMEVASWAQHGGELAERRGRWTVDWCRRKDLNSDGACYCNRLNVKEGRP